jgi:hypothetical protein
MAFKIERFNVLAFEPESVSPGLRIAESILKSLKEAINLPLESISSSFKDLTDNMSLAEFAAFSTQNEIPGNMTNLINDKVPENERFILNANSYGSADVPRSLGDFDRLYKSIEKEGVQVVFFNTVSRNAREDYRTLAQRIMEGKYPALDNSTWFATTSLRESMPGEFLNEVTKRKKTNGRSDKEMTRLFGSSYLIELGDSIDPLKEKEWRNLIHDRLKYIREMGSLAYPVGSNSNGAKHDARTSTRYKKFI